MPVASKIAKILSQSRQLETDLIVDKIMAGKPRPVQCIFALFDPLLCGAMLVVELHYTAGFPAILPLNGLIFNSLIR